MPDVPEKIQNNIDHERFIDQQERWTSETSQENFREAIHVTRALSRLVQESKLDPQPTNKFNENISHRPSSNSTIRVHVRSPVGQTKRKKPSRAAVVPEDT